ncbi:hypothetical protein [Nocardia sp. NPDC051832]|uniref:hypothetical protein n=1 Tax=Nocardia sp. NPDC051832 TaxID=3155673 RepID=UPI0034176B52
MLRRKQVDIKEPQRRPSAAAWMKLYTRRRWTIRAMMACAVASTVGIGVCIHLAAPDDDEFRSGNSTAAAVIAISGVLLAICIFGVDTLIEHLPLSRLLQLAGIEAAVLGVAALGLLGAWSRGAATTEEIVAGAAFFAIALCIVVTSWELSRVYRAAMKLVEP